MMSTATEIKIEPKIEPLNFGIRPDVDGMGSVKTEMENLKVENGLRALCEENKNDENVLGRVYFRWLENSVIKIGMRHQYL